MANHYGQELTLDAYAQLEEEVAVNEYDPSAILECIQEAGAADTARIIVHGDREVEFLFATWAHQRDFLSLFIGSSMLTGTDEEVRAKLTADGEKHPEEFAVALEEAGLESLEEASRSGLEDFYCYYECSNFIVPNEGAFGQLDIEEEEGKGTYTTGVMWWD